MSRSVRIIGAPMDLGADRRGVDMGPSAIRYAGLADALSALDVSLTDRGDLAVTHPELGTPDSSWPDGGHAKYLAEIRELCDELDEAVSTCLSEDAVPVVLGGDHSIAIGTVRASAREADIGVVWFDAHGDFNTPLTTPSGNVHGMPLAAILGEGPFGGTDWAPAAIDPARVALVGTRSLDSSEREAIAASEISVFTMSDIDERGVAAVTEAALSIAESGNTDGVHVSFDMDWLDPNEAPGVGTPIRGGVTYREAHTAMEIVAETELRSLELVEVNPILDQHNQTAELAVELAASALGETIL